MAPTETWVGRFCTARGVHLIPGEESWALQGDKLKLEHTEVTGIGDVGQLLQVDWERCKD